jgi:hypothetical protein
LEPYSYLPHHHNPPLSVKDFNGFLQSSPLAVNHFLFVEHNQRRMKLRLLRDALRQKRALPGAVSQKNARGTSSGGGKDRGL